MDRMFSTIASPKAVLGSHGRDIYVGMNIHGPQQAGLGAYTIHRGMMNARLREDQILASRVERGFFWRLYTWQRYLHRVA